ncbi:MAG: HU family DNA-binding protein [bacterium]
MTRREILKRLKALGLKTENGKKAIDIFFETMTRALEAKKKVFISGFGTWEWKETRARKARNPKTGKTVHLDSRRIIFFKPSRLLKDKLNSSKKT